MTTIRKMLQPASKNYSFPKYYIIYTFSLGRMAWTLQKVKRNYFK